jgi:3-oxoadipate enol-lactonase
MARCMVGDAGLEYRLEGSGRPVVVLLNGIAMSMSHWKPVSDTLVAAGYRVLLHDMRGQLQSDKPPGPYSLELHARDLASLMDQVVVSTAHIVGTSYGAEVALTFARDFPGRCLSVTAIDGVSEFDGVLGAAVDAWKAAALADPRVFYKTIIPWNYSAAFITANREMLAKREDVVAALPREYFEAFARLCDAFMAIDLTKDLGRISCPCLVMVGGHDILKRPAYSRQIANAVSGASYMEITGAGHAVVLEQPQAVSKGLLDFLKSLADA